MVFYLCIESFPSLERFSEEKKKEQKKGRRPNKRRLEKGPKCYEKELLGAVHIKGTLTHCVKQAEYSVHSPSLSLFSLSCMHQNQSRRDRESESFSHTLPLLSLSLSSSVFSYLIVIISVFFLNFFPLKF